MRLLRQIFDFHDGDPSLLWTGGLEEEEGVHACALPCATIHAGHYSVLLHGCINKLLK